jgi:hypothetical protein
LTPAWAAAGAVSIARSARLPTSLRRVQLTLNPFRDLTVKACLVVAGSTASGAASTDSVTLQYKARASGPWRALRTIEPASGSAYCPAGSPVWQGAVIAPLASAYYRLSFAGTPALRGCVSRVVHRWRHLTRISPLQITPRRVAPKGAVTISGRLWRHDGSWRPYAHRKVAILFRYRGAWYRFAYEPRTNSRGFFTGRFTASVSARWLAEFYGAKLEFASVSRLITVTVGGGSGSVRRFAAG